MKTKEDLAVENAISYEKLIIMKLSKTLAIDTNGLRVLDKDGHPINNNGGELNPIKREYLVRAQKFVKLLKKAKRNNRDITSYGLKHDAENYLNSIAKEKYKDTYVSNGALICAMILAGFDYQCFNNIALFQWKPTNKDNVDYYTSINVTFNVYRRQLREIRKLYKIN